jgi:hypothetical protein
MPTEEEIKDWILNRFGSLPMFKDVVVISQAERQTYCMITLVDGSQAECIVHTENRLWSNEFHLE